MAEVATKKSINVVSSNKKSEVCGVQSNNGLIDLDNLTASNNQLISLCDNNDDDDDLVLTNNSRNELGGGGGDDKSLQELIESELALRICSSKNDDDEGDDDDGEVVADEPEEMAAQQPIRRIVLDRRQDSLDVNAEFIAAESEHYALIEEPYGRQNGHASPGANVEDVVLLRDEQKEQVLAEQPEHGDAIVVQKTSDDDEPGNHQDNCEDVSDKDVDRRLVADEPGSSEVACDLAAEPVSQPESSSPPPATCPDKCQQEEESAQRMTTPDEAELPRTEQEEKNIDVSPDTWTEQAPDGQQQAGQFSDNFDETLSVQQERSVVEERVKESSMSEHIDQVDDLYGGHASTEVFLDSNRVGHGEKDASASAVSQDTTSVTTEETSRKLEEEGIAASQSEMLAETASTQEFLDIERRVLSEEADHDDGRKTPQIVVSSSEVGESQPSFDNNEPSLDYAKDVAEDAQNPVDESSSEFSASDSTFIEKTEVVVSDTSVTVFSEMKQIEPLETLDSWTTVEEATKPASSADECKDAPAIGHADQPTSADDNNEGKPGDSLAPPPSPRAPLATPDDETSDISNACDVSVLFSCQLIRDIILAAVMSGRVRERERERMRGAIHVKLYVFLHLCP